MSKLKRRNGGQKEGEILSIPIIPPEPEPKPEPKKSNLTVFPGGKKKEDTQIDPLRMETLKKWRKEELKDYKVSIPDSSVKNPPYQKIAQALIDCDGFIMKAAISLKITYNKINKLIKLNPKLKGIVKDTTEAFLDVTENKLRDAVLAGDKTAIIYTLNSKGRHRGWGDVDATALTDEKPVSFNYNLILPKNYKLVSEDGTEIYKTESKEEIKKIENG